MSVNLWVSLQTVEIRSSAVEVMDDPTNQAFNNAVIEAMTFVRGFLDRDTGTDFSVGLSPSGTAVLGQSLIEFFRAEARRQGLASEDDIRGHVRDRINAVIAARSLDGLNGGPDA
jgi:hypothetical protein